MNALRRLALRLIDSNSFQGFQSRKSRFKKKSAIPADIELLDSRVMLSATAGLQLVVTSQPPAVVTAGQPFSVTVEVQDSLGAVQTGFNGQVSVGEYYFGTAIGDLTVTAVNGVAKFTNVALTTAVNDDFLVFSAVGTVENNVNSSLIQVNPAAASKLLVTSPTVLLTGGNFNLNVVALDDYGNTAKSFQGNVNVAFGNNPTGATLGGNLTVTATNGTAKFTGLNINKAGTGYTLKVSATGPAPGTTQAFNVVDAMVITKQPPASVTAGNPFDVVVKIQDANGAVNTSYNGTVSVTPSTFYNGLTGPLSVTAVNGVATFTGLRLTTPTSAVALHFTATGLTNGEVTSTPIKVIRVPNHAPLGTSKSVTVLEDQPYGFKITDFGFTDPNDTPPDALQAVVIQSLPAIGTLKVGNVVVTVGQSVSAADIAAGKLQFTPAANKNGPAYANFTFRVKDNGGTANGGVDTDATARTMSIKVTSVNDAPVGASKTVVVLEDKTFVFRPSDFAFTDPNDDPQNAIMGVVIGTLPAAGTLTNRGAAVSAGQVISMGDISTGQLQFTPAANKSGPAYANFTFRVKDNGGTANGGVDTDATARTMFIKVTSVNDAPVGASKTVTVLEDKTFVFRASDFAFTDPNDDPQNAIMGVVIGTLPAAGTLTNRGAAVTAGQIISMGDISTGQLQFTPAANKNGTAYTSFTFRVKDNGGTGNGGIDTDLTARTMTINVTPVNDAPVGVSKSVTIAANTSYQFKIMDFPLADSHDNPSNTLAGVVIQSLPTVGALTNAGVAVKVGQVISVGDIVAGKFQFTPVADKKGNNYANFLFRVKDNGGMANGGVDVELVNRLMTINVT